LPAPLPPFPFPFGNQTRGGKCARRHGGRGSARRNPFGIDGRPLRGRGLADARRPHQARRAPGRRASSSPAPGPEGAAQRPGEAGRREEKSPSRTTRGVIGKSSGPIRGNGRAARAGSRHCSGPRGACRAGPTLPRGPEQCRDRPQARRREWLRGIGSKSGQRPGGRGGSPPRVAGPPSMTFPPARGPTGPTYDGAGVPFRCARPEPRPRGVRVKQQKGRDATAARTAPGETEEVRPRRGKRRQARPRGPPHG
jgi:hypothetical protein